MSNLHCLRSRLSQLAPPKNHPSGRRSATWFRPCATLRHTDRLVQSSQRARPVSHRESGSFHRPTGVRGPPAEKSPFRLAIESVSARPDEMAIASESECPASSQLARTRVEPLPELERPAPRQA